mgnify:CR=1 FL=1
MEALHKFDTDPRKYEVYKSNDGSNNNDYTYSSWRD